MKNLKFLFIAFFSFVLTGCFESEDTVNPINIENNIQFVTLNDQMNGNPFSQTVQSISVNGLTIDSSTSLINYLEKGDIIRVFFELKQSKVRTLLQAYDDSLAGMELQSSVNEITKNCLHEFTYSNEAKIIIDIKDYLNSITLKSHRAYASDLACGADANILPWRNHTFSFENRAPINFNSMFSIISESEKSDEDSSGRINLYEYGYDFTNTNTVESFYVMYSSGWFTHAFQSIDNCSPGGTSRSIRKFNDNTIIQQY